MRSFPSYQLLLCSLVLSLIALVLPFFPRVLIGVVSLILVPGFILSSRWLKGKNELENLVFGLLLSFLILSIFGVVALTLLSNQPFWILLILYFGILFIGTWKSKIEFRSKLEKNDKWFLAFLAILLISVLSQNYFLGYETDQGFVSKFTRNDHWYYAASSAEVKNQGLSAYPVYPHLPPEKDRYPVGSFVLFGILSLLLNIPALYLVQYLGILVPLGLSLGFYYGGQLFFKEKKTAFFAFLFGTVLHLGWSFFMSPTSWYRYQNLLIAWWTVPLFMIASALIAWLLSKLYLHSKKYCTIILCAGIALILSLATVLLKSIGTKLSASITWLIPILYYDWTYDSSFVGMQPLQVFFTTTSPKALSFLYQALALLILYKILQEKEKRPWQVLLFLDIALMSFNHPSSFLPFAFFLALLVALSIWHKPFRSLGVPVIAGGIITLAVGLHYALFVASGASYITLKVGLQYSLFAFILFYGFHWLFGYFGWKSMKNKTILTLLSLYVVSHWVFLLLIKNTFNSSDLGRVMSGTLIPLAFLSAAGVSRFNQYTKKKYKIWSLVVWGIIAVLGVCYFLIYPLNFSPLQPNEYLVPKADMEAYEWIRTNTDPNALFIVSLNESEYNSHELTVFGERKALIDSPWNLRLYHYPEEMVKERIRLVNKLYESGLSDESLKKLRDYVDEKLGNHLPLYVFVGSHEVKNCPFLSTLAVDANKVVFNNKEAVLVQIP